MTVSVLLVLITRALPTTRRPTPDAPPTPNVRATVVVVVVVVVMFVVIANIVVEVSVVCARAGVWLKHPARPVEEKTNLDTLD